MISGIELKSQNNLGSKVGLKDDSHFFLKIGKKDFSTQVLDQNFEVVQGYNYRIVHNTLEAHSKHHGDTLYEDPDFTINPLQQFPPEQTTRKVIVKRLSNLYGITNKPVHFFQNSSRPTRQEYNDNLPTCIQELGLLQFSHYKSLFISQQWQESGKYILTANLNGRFEVISVDDRIPIYQDTLEPIWGLSYQNPWEIILIKAFAKIKGGYEEVVRARPFEFIESFTHSTWKYFNLSKEPEKFMAHYHENQRFKNGKIILKTKKDPRVSQDGLQPNSACYELVSIAEEKQVIAQQNPKKSYVLTIRTTERARWTEGKYSLFKPGSEKYYFEGLSLDHDVMMADSEFLRYFASAHITSTRHQDYFTGNKMLQIPRFEKKAQHLEFFISQQGFFDFSIIQFQQNRVISLGQQSRIYLDDNKSARSTIDTVRYLRTKYILVRDNQFQQKEQMLNKKQEENLMYSKVKAVRGDVEFPLPRFTTYEIQYFKGYSKGTAHFVRLDPGRYILRLKSELTETDVKYAINWVCSQQVKLRAANLSSDEEKSLLHDSIVSIMHKYPHFSFDKQKKQEMLTVANSFQEIGYGFASIKCSSSCCRSIIIQIDAKVLYEQGYRLKGKYKSHSDDFSKFSIKVEAGEYDSIVFKKRKDTNTFMWPTKSIRVYNKDIKEPQSHAHIPIAQSQLAYESGIGNVDYIKEDRNGPSNIQK